MVTPRERLRSVMARTFLLVLLSFIPSVAAGQAFTFLQRSVTKTEGRCEEPETPCASISLSYPEFTSAPTDRAKDALNKYIRETLLMPPFGEPKPAASLDEIATRFIEAYQQARRELPDMPARWTHDSKVTVLYQDDRAISLRVVAEEYTGGAHPNQLVTQATFHPRIGRKFGLDDLFDGAYRESLRAAAEQAFRAVRKIAPATPLPEAGYSFPNDKFAINENFAVTAEGLSVYFNSYEIAPYALGPTDLVIPATELKPLAKRGGPFDRGPR